MSRVMLKHHLNGLLALLDFTDIDLRQSVTQDWVWVRDLVDRLF